MANKFELAEPAKEDLKRIWTYIAEFNPHSADKFLREFAKKFQLLADNPQLGRLQDDFILNLRNFPYKDYTIFYFPIENGVEIYRVLHGARNIESLSINFLKD